MKRFANSSLFFAVLMSGRLATFAAAGDSDMQKKRERLIRGRPDEQQAAMVELAHGGKESVGVLCDILKNEPDPAVRSRAASTLHENLLNPNNRDDSTLSRVESVARHEDGDVAGLSSMALSQFKGHRRARAILKDVAKAQRNEHIRAQVLSAFAANIDGDRSELPFLSEFLNDKSEYVSVSAAGFLGMLGDKRGLRLCREILERRPTDEAMLLQRQAAVAAGRIGDPSLIPLLSKIGSSNEYGLTQWHARIAIREIEYQQEKAKGTGADYLKGSFGSQESSKWAVKKLLAIKGPQAVEILEWAAGQKELAGSAAAARALIGIKR